jgi:hypothetical protein
MSDKALSVPLLTELNYIEWRTAEQACLCQLGIWHIVDDEWTGPELFLIEHEVKEDRKKGPPHH